MDISEIEFGSLLSYSVRGTSQKAEESKSAMRNLKGDNVLNPDILTSEYVAQAIKKRDQRISICRFFQFGCSSCAHTKKFIANSRNALSTRKNNNSTNQQWIRQII